MKKAKDTDSEHPNLKNVQKHGKRSFLNIIFGRSMMVAVLIVLQLIVLISLFAQWQFSIYAYGGTYIVSAVMAFYLINHSMNATYRQTWLVLVLLFPVIGTLFYLYIELEIGHRAMRARLDEIQKETANLLPKDEKLMSQLQVRSPDLYSLASYAQRVGSFPIYRNTQVTYFPNGEDKLRALLPELEKAEKFIFMEYFIVEEGYMWDSILEILERKAREGVEVRVMYDGTCSFFRLPYHYPEKLRAMGIQCKMFAPIRPVLSTYHNNRDHRKILVIDGHTAITGGINLADEYINKKVVYGKWKDTAVMLKGEAAHSFTLMFLQMWNADERANPSPYEPYISAPIPEMPPTPGYVLPYADSPFDDERTGENIYLDIINRAGRYVHIMTPYLIIDTEMTTALTFAAKRGVDVRLILPHIPDKKTAFSIAYTHYKELLQAGVRIYEYTPGFVHAKVFVCDDSKAVVGTINLDYRSLYLHFECAAYMQQVPVIAEIEQDFRSTLKKCEQITLDNLKTIPLYRKIMGPLLKLIAPLM